jgi:hypothetical protein
MKARIHRFRDKVAVHLDDGKTVYLTTSFAFSLANGLIAAAQDVCTSSFQESNFDTIELEQIDTNLVAEVVTKL